MPVQPLSLVLGCHSKIKAGLSAKPKEEVNTSYLFLGKNESVRTGEGTAALSAHSRLQLRPKTALLSGGKVCVTRGQIVALSASISGGEREEGFITHMLG